MITFFGFIWIILCIYCFARKDIKYMLILTLFSMLFQCSNVLILGTLKCGPQLFTSFLFILKSYLYVDRQKIDVPKSNKTCLTMYLIFLGYIIINSLFINYGRDIFMSILSIFIYTICSLRIYKFSYVINKEELTRIIFALTIFILVVGGIQLLINILNLPKMNLFQIIFFNESNSESILYFKPVTRFYSTFMESSYVAGLLVGLLAYIVMNSDMKKIKNVLICGGLVLSILLTFSSTAYGVLFIMFILYYMKNYKYKKIHLIVIIAVIAAFILGTTTNVLNDVIFQKASSGSAKVREVWNNYAYSQYLLNPTFGNGYDYVRASSIIYDILAELGIIGLLIYITPVFLFVRNFLSKKSDITIASTSAIVLSVIVSQLIACPDYSLCSFWLALYIYCISLKNKKGDEVNE